MGVSAVLTAAALLFVPGSAGQHTAAPTKDELLALWTQPSSTSETAFRKALAHRDSYAEYQFDWTTDYCTDVPERPLGYPFGTACRRHDFGYRNYAEAGAFRVNRKRLDKAFLQDMRRRCATVVPEQRRACTAVAWTYYLAVRAVGTPEG
ncbi:phospholipase [Actinoplanes sp. NPDC051851]|uniref:phospholipase n=1 Tax=Actinoplanes sp. NPDC051851 TaxID=3154753 RepID=UPI003416736C